MKKLSVVLIAALVLSFSAFAATIHVPGGYPTIQAGIDAAVDGDTVLVADGTFTGIGNKNIDFTGKEIVVMSENGPETCIIDCEDDGRGFYFHSGEDTSSVISSMKIINGSISYGGGIFCAVASSPIIDNCIITENNTTWGGGIYCQSNSSPIISNCDISRNSANWNGGGMYFSASSATIINCTIIENSAYNGYGGGIYLDVSNPIIENCTLSGSVGNYGGGIRCNGSNPNIINTIVENNTSGGIYFDGSSNSSINYSDFYNNEDGNFIGSIPVGLGIIALINTNGDSCDQFYNIFM
nr:right-handed parallel beta-helix repeat-containing protein [FCB group bacterium]